MIDDDEGDDARDRKTNWHRERQSAREAGWVITHRRNQTNLNRQVSLGEDPLRRHGCLQFHLRWPMTLHAVHSISLLFSFFDLDLFYFIWSYTSSCIGMCSWNYNLNSLSSVFVRHWFFFWFLPRCSLTLCCLQSVQLPSSIHHPSIDLPIGQHFPTIPSSRFLSVSISAERERERKLN